MAAGVLSPDGLPRFVWTDAKPDPTTYTLTLLRAVAERQRWRTQYDQAKATEPVDNCSATAPDPPLPTARPHPMTRRTQGRRTGRQG
jgi:hypothetical protein